MKPRFTPEEFWQRFFESLPDDWETRFLPGDQVALVREDMWWGIPIGTVGEVRTVAHPEDAMAQKGRPYHVMFDVSAHKIPIPERDLARIREVWPDAPAYHQNVGSNFAPQDLVMVAKKQPGMVPLPQLKQAVLRAIMSLNVSPYATSFWASWEGEFLGRLLAPLGQEALKALEQQLEAAAPHTAMLVLRV